jgi:hypothetical protein
MWLNGKVHVFDLVPAVCHPHVYAADHKAELVAYGWEVRQDTLLA